MYKSRRVRLFGLFLCSFIASLLFAAVLPAANLPQSNVRSAQAPGMPSSSSLDVQNEDFVGQIGKSAPAMAVQGNYVYAGDELVLPDTSLQTQNVALGKPVSVVTNGANDNRESPGLYPSDITDGSLDYLPSSWAQEDGTVGYVNDDYGELMRVTVTIDLQGTYDVSQIRYNMGHVQHAETWNADWMTTPLGKTATESGTTYQGAWTEQNGNATLSSVTIVFEKTRVSFPTDWLFIGELEIIGSPAGSYRPVFDFPFDYPGRGIATEEQFVAVWQRCTTAFFDHKFPGAKGTAGDGLLWFWTGDSVPGTNCTLFENCYDGHEGTDFDDWACYGNAVFPAASGQIIAAETGWRSDGYGNRVVIQHGNSDYKTMYGHLSSILITSGDVDVHEQIGLMGESGCQDCGTHLHFNVYYKGRLVDPSGWNGNFPDPYVAEQTGPISYRQWLFPVHRSTPVKNSLGTDFVAPSGNTIAYIPSNVYGEDFELTVFELPPLWVPNQLVSAAHAAVFSAQTAGGQAITKFDNNYTVEFRFDENDITGIDANTLAIYLWDSNNNIWKSLPTDIDLPSSLAGSSSDQNLGTAQASMEEVGYVALLGDQKRLIYMSITIRSQ